MSSGVKRLVLAESKGLEVPTNDELRDEAVAHQDKDTDELPTKREEGRFN